MGLFHRAIENSRQPERGQKTRRDLSLKSRLDLNLDVGSRPRFGARFGAEEIKVALDGTAGAELDVKGLKAGILCQNSYAVLAVLNDGVVDLQFPLGSYDIISAVTFVKEIAKDTKFPIVSQIINQGRFWEDAFQTELVSEQPDQAAAGGHDWVLIEATTEANNAEDFIFLERETDEHFPRNVDGIAGNIILEIGAGIYLDSRAGMIVRDIFQS